MKTLGKILAAATMVVAGACLLGNPQFAASPQRMADMPHEQASDEPIPTFHTQAPKDALPPTMESSLFTNMVVANAYRRGPREESALPGTLLLPLRPQHGPRKLARLLRQPTRFGMRHLHEGSPVRLRTDAQGQNSGANPRGHHPRRLAAAGSGQVPDRSPASGEFPRQVGSGPPAPCCVPAGLLLPPPF